jgi:hypothetical protein
MFLLRIALTKIMIPLSTIALGSLVLSACGPNTSKLPSSALQSLDPAIVDADNSKGETSKSTGNYQTLAPAQTQASSKSVPASSSSSVSSSTNKSPSAAMAKTSAASSLTAKSTAQVVSKSVLQAATSNQAPASNAKASTQASATASSASNTAVKTSVVSTNTSPSMVTVSKPSAQTGNSATPVVAKTISTKSSSPASNALSNDLPKIKFSLDQDSADDDHTFDSIKLERPQLDQMASVWTDEDNTQNWTEAVLKVIDQNFASFDSAEDTETFCPGYKDATKRQKEICWLRIIGGVVYFESHFDPIDYFKEPKTGNLSIGLLSLSPKECDNAPTLESLRNPVANLICGTLKMAQLISQKKFIDGPNHEGAAQYWSTLRPAFDYVDKDRGRTLHLGKKNDIIDITSNYQEFK